MSTVAGAMPAADTTVVSESASGVLKRLVFARAAIDRFGPAHILDIGCGSGEQLTKPLAAAYPGITVTGVDSDATSIEFARRSHALPNLEYLLDDELPADRQFDFIIVSEVLEHVEEPIAFLGWVRERLALDGAMLLTTPNGYGPSESAAMLFGMLRWSGLYSPIHNLRRRGNRSAAATAGAVGDTLAVSPHVNFFSYSELHRIFDSAGLRIVDFRPRTFLCGFGFEGLIRRASLEEWNARVADRLSPWLVSDWMFILRPNRPPGDTTYVRGPISRWRRSLHRWMADHPLRMSIAAT